MALSLIGLLAGNAVLDFCVIAVSQYNRARHTAASHPNSHALLVYAQFAILVLIFSLRGWATLGLPFAFLVNTQRLIRLPLMVVVGIFALLGPASMAIFDAAHLAVTGKSGWAVFRADFGSSWLSATVSAVTGLIYFLLVRHVARPFKSRS